MRGVGMRRKAIRRALFCCGLLAILWFLFPVRGDVPLILRQNDSHIIADSTGPTFAVIDGNTSTTFPPGADPVNFTLGLEVEVTDPDGVDMVIGSHRLDSEAAWHNTTLAYTPTTDHPDLYSAFVMNNTLGPEHWNMMWYFKFYANDSLGNWASTGVWYRSADIEVGNTTGPEFFSPNGNLFVDLVPNYPDYPLVLTVQVTDPDGVDTVIGCYRLDSETTWHNITLTHTPRADFPDVYSAYVMTYTFGGTDWSVIWYFKFYANDSLGNWATSEVYFESIAGGELKSLPSMDLPEIPYILIARIVVAVVVTVFVVVLLLKYREVR
jgi:hypothetical protein